LPGPLLKIQIGRVPIQRLARCLDIDGQPTHRRPVDVQTQLSPVDLALPMAAVLQIVPVLPLVGKTTLNEDQQVFRACGTIQIVAEFLEQT